MLAKKNISFIIFPNNETETKLERLLLIDSLVLHIFGFYVHIQNSKSIHNSPVIIMIKHYAQHSKENVAPIIPILEI